MKCLQGFCLVAFCIMPVLGTTVNGPFAPPTGDRGPTETFNFSGFVITAAGFTDGGSPVHLFGKTGTGETGLGLVNDSSGQDEITNGSFIQLDISSLLGLGPLTITMNSTTSGETWKVTAWGGASGTLGSAIPTCSVTNCMGTTESPFTVSPTLKYLDFTVPSNTQSWNVLLSSISFQTSSTPEPVSFVLAGTGLLGLYFIRRRRAGRC
jgi:hypothetical protein